MNITEQAHFDELYNRHLRALKLRGMSDATIDSYARAVRRIAEHFDCSPEKLSTEQLAHLSIFLTTNSLKTMGYAMIMHFRQVILFSVNAKG